MCSSSWSMAELIKPFMWQPCLHMHCFLPTAFAYVSNFHCWWQCWSVSICCGSFHDCIQIRFNSQLERVTQRCCSSPARFDRSFVISIEYSYTYFIVLLKLRRMCRKSYCFSLPWTMTTTGSLFFSFQLPGLCGSGAYVFSSGNRNSRRDLGEVAPAWITEVYRCIANRGKHFPSEKLKVVCRNGWTPRSMSSTQTLHICVSSFNVFIVITCERVCGNGWQTALQPCLIIALLMCSLVATLVPITWSSLNV